MLSKPAAPAHAEVFAEPTPLGLIGLAIGCAALTPIAFGVALTPAALKTAAIFCLLFGGGCQFLAGMMNFANRNLYGGTILTAFSFNWVLNWWVLDALSQGLVPDHAVVLATETLSLVIFVVITYGFGFFSKLLFYFLLDIDLLYAAKVIKGFTVTRAMDLPIAAFTIALGLIALWIAFAMLINPTAGRSVFAVSGPMFLAPKKQAFDFSSRQAIFDALYAHWRDHAFAVMPLPELERAVRERAGARNIVPELFYLMERGGLILALDGDTVRSARLSAAGIDLYEQQVLRKHAA